MSESPEEQPSTGVLGRIGSWLSPWRARTPKSPSETFFPTTDQPLKSDREKGSEESVKPQREEVKEQSSDLSRDFVPCEEEDATQSAHREGSILGSPVTAYPKEEEFAGRRKRRTGQGKEWEESNLGTSESGNPEKNASHLTDHSSSSEQGVVWDSAYSLPQAQSREQAQTGKRLHVYLKETSVVQCGLDAFVGQEVVQTKFTGSIPFPRKSSSSFDSLEASCFTSEEGKQTNLSPIIGTESDNSGLKGLSLKSRKNLQFGLEETDTERMGRKNASRRKSTKSPHGDGGTSLQEKMPPSADHAPEGFPKSDNTVLSPEGKSPKTLKGESCVNSSSKHSPTSQTSPEEEKKETSCKTLDKFQESNSVIAAPLASVVDGAADMADDNSLYKLERKTETPESKRRSMKVSKSEVKMFTKYVSLNAQKGSAGDNQVGNTKEETEEIVTRPHDLKTITEERKPVAGRIADKINIFEQPAAGGFNRETFHTPRNVDVSPVRTATQRLKANFELREQRSNSAERYKHARSSPDSPTREGLKQIKGQVGNFTSKTDDVRATRPKTATTGMPIQSTATAAVASLKAQKLDSQGKLDTREELQKTTPAETTIKPDQRDITALGGKNLTPKEQPSDSISIDIAHQGDGVEANVPAKQASNTVEPIPNIGQHSKGPNRTGSRSKRRKSKEPSTSIIPSSENKPEDSASKPDETDAKPEQVEDQAKGRTSDELTVPVEKENNTFKGFDEPKKQSDASFTKENIDKPLSKQEPEPLVSKDEPDTAAGSRATKTSIDKKSDILPQKEGKAAGHSFLLTQRRENVSEDSQKTLAPSTSPVDDQLLAKQETPVKLEPELLMQSEEKSERGVRERNKNDTGQTDRNINISGGGTESVRTEQTQLVRDKRKPQTSRLEPASNSFERISLDPLTTTTNLEKSASAQTNNEAVLSESDGEPTKDLKSKETPGTESAVAAAEPQPHSVFLEKAENTPDDSCKHGANDAEFSSEKPFTKASEEVTVEAANASPVLITSKADSLSEPGREESAPISVTKSLSSEEAKPPTVKSVPSEVRISADIMTLSPTNPQSETSNNAESKSDFSSLKRAGEAEQRHSDSSASASTAEKGLLSPFGNGDFFSHPHILKKEQAIENKPSHTPKEETSLEDAKKIPDSFQRSSLKKRQFPRGLSKDDSSIGQDAPSSWLDVDFPKHKLKAFAPKLSSSGSESNLLDNSGELDDDDFVEKIKNLCAPFSLPPRKHYPLRPPQPPFAMPAIREDRFEKTFDPDEFKFGLSKKKKYSMDASLNTLAKLHSIEKKSALKPARASLVDRSILLSSWDPQSLLKNSNLDEEEEEFKEEIDDQIKVKSRLEGSCVLNILTSSSFRGKRNGVQAEGQQPGEVSPSETPQISLPPSYQPPMPSPTATTPLKDPFAKQIPDPSNREETLSSETVVSESGPPLPSFNDIKLPDYLEKYLPRESAKSGQSEQKQEQVQKKVVAKPSTPALGDETDHPVNKTGLTLPEAKPPSFPGIPPTTQPMLPERKNPQAPPQGRFNHKRAAKGFHKRPGKMVLFENAQFTGQTYEIHRDLADASSLQLSPLISVKVVRGCWLLYEKPDFQGRSIALEEGEIELTDVWAEPDMEKKPQGNPAMQIGSIRLAVCDYCIPRIDLFTEPEGHGRGTPYHDDTIEAGSFGIPLSTASIQVHSGVWLLFSDPGFQGMLAVLEPGVYPFPETWGFPAPFVGSLRPLKMGGFKVENPSEAKAVVYEKPAFEGSSLKIDNDVFMFGESEGCLSADAATVDTEQLKSVASLKIIGGLWVGYSEPGFEGQQHILEEGEYLNCSEWGGSEQLVSMRPILSDFLSPHLKMFSDIDFAERGLNIDLTVPVINLEDTGYGMKTQSVDVMSGIWVVFEEPGFCGEPYILEKGLYGSPEDWGALQPRVASAMPVVLNDFKNADKLKVKLFSEPGFQGSVLVLQDSVASLQDGFSVASCKVLAGSWLAFEGQDFAGRMYVLEVGHYSDLRAMGCVSPTSSILSLQTVGFEFSMPSITLFTRCGLRGKRVILSDATVNLQHAGSCSRVQSLLVEGGIWVLYEGINYRGPQILLKPGEVPDWRELSGWPKIGSLRPLLQKQVHFRLRSRQTGLMMAVTGDLDELKLMRIQETEETGGFEQIWFYQNGQLHCKLLEDCCLGPSSSVIIAGGRVGLNPEPENQVHSWSVTPEGLICYTPDPNLVLEVKGGHHYDKNQVILNTLDPNKLQQQWNLEII